MYFERNSGWFEVSSEQSFAESYGKSGTRDTKSIMQITSSLTFASMLGTTAILVNGAQLNLRRI